MLDVNLEKIQGNFSLKTAFMSDGFGITALFGHSGAGKTSIINMIAGLIRPDFGHIIVNDRCVFNSQKNINMPPEKRRFGYVFQEGRLFPHMSVKSNLVYGMNLIPAKERRIKFDSVVDLLGIGHLLDRQPVNLSGGEKQRVAIGRSLLTSPCLLLMDEPLASLDAARKSEVLPFISRLPSEMNTPILYVSHSLDEILNLADNMVFLNAGKPVAVGSVEEISSRFDFQKITGRMESGVVISTIVEGHDTLSGISYLRFAGGRLSVPRFDAPEDAPVRVRIHPRNVAVALTRPSDTSFQNIFSGVVEKIVTHNGDLVDVRLNIGCPLLATITPGARDALNLTAGSQVFALIKSVSVSVGH